MLPTPSTSHIPPQVYTPAEDSYLLLDTLSASSETSFLASRFPSAHATPLLVELGTGSGVVLTFLLTNAYTIFSRSDIIAFGVDVSSYACQASRETVQIAYKAASNQEATGELLGVLQADLLSSLRNESVDMLVFNPPYVPTDNLPAWEAPENERQASGKEAEFMEEGRLLQLAYAGGHLGMEVTNRFLEEIPRVLSERGVFYLLLCLGNRPVDVVRRIEGWSGRWKTEVVGRSGKTAGWEKLVVLRGWRI